LARAFLFTDCMSPYLPHLVAVRIEVFVLEQSVPLESEIDALDKYAVHEVVLDGKEVIGTLRILFSEGAARIGRVAVRKRWRNQGIGREMMLRAIDYIHKKGYRVLLLDAQVSAKDFYTSLGFTEEGDVFEDSAILHVKMSKLLPEP
jgi:predicted GNAT family N-acyltransferase